MFPAPPWRIRAGLNRGRWFLVWCAVVWSGVERSDDWVGGTSLAMVSACKRVDIPKEGTAIPSRDELLRIRPGELGSVCRSRVGGESRSDPCSLYGVAAIEKPSNSRIFC